jgi:hypothetical protein
MNLQRKAFYWLLLHIGKRQSVVDLGDFLPLTWPLFPPLPACQALARINSKAFCLLSAFYS